jgi:cerevisin
VINISLGGGKSRALEEAINRAIDAGVHFAVAAGAFHFGTAVAYS